MQRPCGWEIVQLVGLQTLDLAILVRVQVSQPKLNHLIPFGYLDLQFTSSPSVSWIFPEFTPFSELRWFSSKSNVTDLTVELRESS